MIRETTVMSTARSFILGADTLMRVRNLLRRSWFALRGFRHFHEFPFDTKNPLPAGALSELIAISSGLSKFSIQHFVRDGTLLGLHRGGSLIAHDSDLDIGVIGTESATSVLEYFASIGWKLGQSVSMRGRYYHLSFYSISNCIVDITFFEERDKGYFSFGEIDYYLFYPKHLISPLTNYNFGVCELPAPAKIQSTLEMTYGPDWRIPEQKKIEWRDTHYGVAVKNPGSVFRSFKTLR